MTLLWTLDELIATTGGTLHGTSTLPGATGINFDSRAIMAGDVFIALPGETPGGRDGHEFANGAVQNGACLAIVSQSIAAPHILVRDTMTALTDLAVAARTRCSAKRAAVTGSVGKTGTTRAIEAGLAAAGTAHGPVGSFNNHIGVPLTLARMPRDTQRAVFELGMNHADEIAPLSKLVAPDVALITTVGAVHTENFPDGEVGVARAKAEIFQGMQPGSLAVLNRDNKWFDLLAAEAQKYSVNIASFGTHADATARLLQTDLHDAGLHINAAINGMPLTFDIKQRGEHWALNSLAVLLVLEATDVAREQALGSLKNFTPLAGRGASHILPVNNGTYQLIDESYNANPISMRATLNYLGRQPGRRIAVLTDMLELGPQSAQWHADLAEVIETNKIDLVFCAGPLMQHLWEALPASRRGGYASTATALTPAIQAALQPGDKVLIKGSKGSKAAAITEALLDRRQNT